MSDDPSSIPADAARAGEPIPPAAPEAVDPSPGISRFLKQKKRYRRTEGAEEEEASSEEDEIALLSSALELARARRKQISESPRPSPATTVNRFVPTSDTSAPPAAPALPEPAGADAKSNVALMKFKASESELRWRNEGPRPRPWLRLALGLGTAAVCAAIGFAVGRRAAPREGAALNKAPEATVAAAAPWQPPYLETVRQARVADHAGDLRTALRLLNELAKSVPLSPGLIAYRATLSTRLGYFNDSDADLNLQLSLNVPPDVAATLNAARAFNYVRWRRFGLAVETFAAVEQASPTDVFNLLQWGETLRRKGNLPEAIAIFQEASSRIDLAAGAYAEPQREYIAYTRRLSLVESGRDADLQPELDQRLAEPAPSGYWLLTAAAVALQKDNLIAAVDVLQKAQAVLSPEQFRALLGDYFFRSFAHHPELTPFMPASTFEQQQARLISMAYFIDP